ncbi:adenylyltransferase and sulfurtransferase MOCS3-like [Choristoneura fumiferana]|uniref:adenylyltransferase and sulfurtransferase MOCS3-like n=1 Tax=Choristoneura fumiferana TaxID=7141 RepID=UPI003D159368
MECINKLEKEIVDLRKILVEKENELYELKKKWVSKPHLESQLHVNSDGFQNQTKVDRLPKWAIERYSRQILLPEIGVEGQVKLCAARVLVVGAGGLGCPAAVYLAGAGVGEIGLVDYDTVDLTNIHRQFLHTENDQHQSKVQSAADALRRINSNITINQHNVQLDSSNALGIVNKYDVVLDCTDNVPTRYLLNDACVLTKLPLISGSALKMEGQLTVYGYRDSNPVEKVHLDTIHINKNIRNFVCISIYNRRRHFIR